MNEVDTMKKVLYTACAKLGLQPNVTVLSVDHKKDRWILTYDQDPNYPEFYKYMLKLEVMIRDIMGNQNIELMLEAEEDKNKRDVRTGRGAKMVNARNVDSIQ